jgi:hypothetical protein
MEGATAHVAAPLGLPARLGVDPEVT